MVVLFAPAAAARTARLSNVKLPVDHRGEALITGEADVLHDLKDGVWYLYFNNWGACPGVDCCNSERGCASCCFAAPPHPFAPGCGSPANGSSPRRLGVRGAKRVRREPSVG